jgi:hypothetical protein
MKHIAIDTPPISPIKSPMKSPMKSPTKMTTATTDTSPTAPPPLYSPMATTSSVRISQETCEQLHSPPHVPRVTAPISITKHDKDKAEDDDEHDEKDTYLIRKDLQPVFTGNHKMTTPLTATSLPSTEEIEDKPKTSSAISSPSPPMVGQVKIRTTGSDDITISSKSSKNQSTGTDANPNGDGVSGGRSNGGGGAVSSGSVSNVAVVVGGGGGGGGGVDNKIFRNDVNVDSEGIDLGGVLLSQPQSIAQSTMVHDLNKFTIDSLQAEKKR